MNSPTRDSKRLSDQPLLSTPKRRITSLPSTPPRALLASLRRLAKRNISPVSVHSDDDILESVDLPSPVSIYGEGIEHCFQKLHIQQPTHAIFEIPEIVNLIIRYVDSGSSVPHEASPERRRPDSLQHALLMYGNEAVARRKWVEAQRSLTENNGQPQTSFTSSQSLHYCLLVNRLWNRITLDILNEKVYFTDITKFEKYSNKVKGLTRSGSSGTLFVLHKLSKAKQEQLDNVAPYVSGRLQWLEMYICPKLTPPPCMFDGGQIEKLILPGCKMISDSFLISIASKCPKLKHLDLRACDIITDLGIAAVAEACRELCTLNLGRHNNGHLITGATPSIIAAKCPLIETLGLAGCFINDASIWEVAMNTSVKRLSLNNCQLLTNDSIPSLLQLNYFKSLRVLEIRNTNITHMRPLVQYKRYMEHSGKPVLIEGCQTITRRLQEEEHRLDIDNSRVILCDLQNWVNEDD